jgi:lysozyme
MAAGKGNNKRRGASVPEKKGRKSLFLLKPAPRKKGKNPVRKSSRKKRSGKPSIVPDWLYWLVTALLIVLISIVAYIIFLRPYFYRWRPCQGTKEYGVCLPSGFLCYGIDISHHQGRIDWNRVAGASAANGYPIRFAIMKATEGSTFTDQEYPENIRNARAAGFVCGVYHFYNPGTSPEKQAVHYINTVELLKGDFVPVVDVERTGRSSAELQRELLIFLKALEHHYGVKPIIYASSKFRKRHLDNPAFDSYPFWVAHYYVVRPETTKPWVLWQFTDHASVEGIREYTDLNVFRGSEADFQSLRIK